MEKSTVEGGRTVPDATTPVDDSSKTSGPGAGAAATTTTPSTTRAAKSRTKRISSPTGSWDSSSSLWSSSVGGGGGGAGAGSGHHPLDLELGTQVWIRRKGQPQMEGEVAYLGPVQFASGNDWVGICLTGPSIGQGKHSGTVNHIEYFKTKHVHQGLFVRKSALRLRMTTATANRLLHTMNHNMDCNNNNNQNNNKDHSFYPHQFQYHDVPSPTSPVVATAAATESETEIQTPNNINNNRNNNRNNHPTTTVMMTPERSSTKSSPSPMSTPHSVASSSSLSPHLIVSRRYHDTFQRQTMFRTPLITTTSSSSKSPMPPRHPNNLKNMIPPRTTTRTTTRLLEPQDSPQQQPPMIVNHLTQNHIVGPDADQTTTEASQQQQQQEQQQQKRQQQEPCNGWQDLRQGEEEELEGTHSSTTNNTWMQSSQSSSPERSQQQPPSTNRRRPPSSSSLNNNNMNNNMNNNIGILHEQPLGPCQAFWCCLFILASLVPPTLFSIDLMVPSSSSTFFLPFIAILGDDDSSSSSYCHFLTKLTGGLLLSQVGTSLCLLLPLLLSLFSWCRFSFLYKCCCCACCLDSRQSQRRRRQRHQRRAIRSRNGTTTRTNHYESSSSSSSLLSLHAARMSGLLSAWMGLLVLVLTFWLSPTTTTATTNDNNDDEDTANDMDDNHGRYILLITGSAITLLLAALGLMISFWPPSQNHDHEYDRRMIPRRHDDDNEEEEMETVDDHNDDNGTNDFERSMIEPLLEMDRSSNDSNHGIRTREEDDEFVDEEEATADRGDGNNDDEQQEQLQPVETTTSRVRGTRRLLQLASSQVLYLYLGCLILLIRLPFSLAIPHFVSTTLAALGQGEFNEAHREIFYLFVLGSIDAVLDFWCIFLFGYANQRIVRGVRLDLFHRLLQMEVAFFDMNNSGTLASRLNSDCSEMAGDLTWFFRFSIESIVRITGITVYMLIRSPRLGACALSIVPVVGVINKLYGDWLRKNAIAVQDALAEANAVAQEALSNVRTVICFAAEDLEEEHYRTKIDLQFQLNVQQLFMQGVYYMAVSTFLINTFVQAALLYLGAHLIERDKLTADVLLAFMLYQGQLQNETLNLFQSFSSLIKSSGAGDKVFALLDRHPPPPAMGSFERRRQEQEPTFPPQEQDEMALSYDLRLDRVSFSYPSRPAQRILDNMVLNIPKGSTVALVGPSGCGKTTVGIISHASLSDGFFGGGGGGDRWLVCFTNLV